MPKNGGPCLVVSTIKPTVALAAIALLAGGCTSYETIDDKNQKFVPNVWEGALRDLKGGIACNGAVEVNYYGDLYWFCFKTTAASPNDFYFTMARDYSYATKLPLKTVEARGSVQLIGERQVVFDVQYRDENGAWTDVPFNGRRKVDHVWPDDLPKKPDISL
jgi:hypothetical protein